MHLLDNLADLYMWCDMQKFKPILQSKVINILASKFVAWIQKHALSSSSFQISGNNTVVTNMVNPCTDQKLTRKLIEMQ